MRHLEIYKAPGRDFNPAHGSGRDSNDLGSGVSCDNSEFLVIADRFVDAGLRDESRRTKDQVFLGYHYE